MPVLEDGQIFERYRIIKWLGSGVTGESYEAEDRVLQRKATLKLIHPWFNLPDAPRRQFFREMQGISALNHPYLASVLDYGEVDGRLYVARRYVSSGSLLGNNGRLWFRPPLSVSDAFTYAHQLAQALYYIHQHGYLHGSLTFANVLVLRGPNLENEANYAPFLLCDIGLSNFVRRFGKPLIETQPISAAPEQLGKRVTPASDQFALAVLLYFWLSGRPPYVGTPAEVEQMKLSETILPLSTLNSAISFEQDGIILRALSVYPEDRHASVLAFTEALTDSLIYNSRALPPTPDAASIPEEIATPSVILWSARPEIRVPTISIETPFENEEDEEDEPTLEQEPFIPFTVKAHEDIAAPISQNATPSELRLALELFFAPPVQTTGDLPPLAKIESSGAPPTGISTIQIPETPAPEMPVIEEIEIRETTSEPPLDVLEAPVSFLNDPTTQMAETTSESALDALETLSPFLDDIVNDAQTTLEDNQAEEETFLMPLAHITTPIREVAPAENEQTFLQPAPFQINENVAPAENEQTLPQPAPFQINENGTLWLTENAQSEIPPVQEREFHTPDEPEAESFASSASVEQDTSSTTLVNDQESSEENEQTSEIYSAPDVEVISPRLIITSPYRSSPYEFLLHNAEISIGRAGASDLLLDLDNLTSRHHALIKRSGHRTLVFDKRSNNGVFINGQKIEAERGYELADGDHISIGNYELIFRHVPDDTIAQLI